MPSSSAPRIAPVIAAEAASVVSAPTFNTAIAVGRLADGCIGELPSRLTGDGAAETGRLIYVSTQLA